MADHTQLSLAQPQLTSPHLSSIAPPSDTNAEAGSTMSFVDLPAEIRNMIYHYLFPEGRSAAQLLTRNSGKGFIAMSDRLGLLATCRQMYEETTSFLQGAHRVTVVESSSLEELIRDIVDTYGYTWNPVLSLILPTDVITLAFDLDNRTLEGNAPGLMFTSKWLQGICMARAESVNISASLTSRSMEADFEGFRVLQQWIDSWLTNCFQDTNLINLEVLFVLSYDLSFSADPKCLRFDATSFVEAIKSACIIESRVQINVRHDDVESAEVPSVLKIYERLLVFLWRLIEHQPEMTKDLCPKVWFDCHFWPREAEFTNNAGETCLCVKAREVGFSQKKQEKDCDEAWDAMVRVGGLEPGFDAKSLVGVAVDLAQRIADQDYW